MSVTIMQLKEVGKLELDDPISSYLSWFSSDENPKIQQLTIRQLLSQTSGLMRDGDNASYWVLDRDFPEADEMKDIVQTARLSTIDGKKIKYSNIAYAYLGLLIESVSGMTYNNYIQEKIIQPLGLSQTSPEMDPSLLVATGYSESLFNQKRTSFKSIDTKTMSPVTGGCSTGVDLCKFFAALCDGDETILSDVSKREMRQGDHQLGLNENSSYGLGLCEWASEDGLTYYGHRGRFLGYASSTQFDPNNGLVISVSTNALDGPAGAIAQQVTHIINYFQWNQGDVEDADMYNGRFFSLWNVIDIVNVNGQLFATNPTKWSAFAADATDKLSQISDVLLKTEINGDSLFSGENVELRFANEILESIKYAGVPMVRENHFLKKIASVAVPQTGLTMNSSSVHGLPPRL